MKEACNENKKEESFGFFLKECRMKNAITLEQLSQGLCSASGLARIEAGTRTAGKALQDRLLCRLGISPDIYEHFLFEESYRQWKKRQQLLCAVTRRSAEEADRLLPCHWADSTLTRQHQVPHLSKVLLDWALVSHCCFCDYHFL